MTQGTLVTETDLDDPNDPVTLKPFKRREKSAAHNAAEWLGIIIAALACAFVIRTYVLQTFWIPSASMETTLMIQDHIIANKVAYNYGEIERGDIVVFVPPADYNDIRIKHLVKRVIGLPGDTLEAREGRMYVNGEVLSEPYLPPGTLTTNLPPTQVPQGEYFMMGDNRSNSQDSRTPLGTIERDLIVGRADFRIWPFGRLGGL